MADWSWEGAGMGALSGAAAGSAFGPWGTAIGGVAGGLGGGFLLGPQESEMTDEMKEQLALLQAIGGPAAEQLIRMITQGTLPKFIRETMKKEQKVTRRGINWQAELSRENVMSELQQRGILASSEAPQALSVLESQRLGNIRQAFADIRSRGMGAALQYQNMLAQMAGMPMQAALGMGQLGLGYDQLAAQQQQFQWGLPLDYLAGVGQYQKTRAEIGQLTPGKINPFEVQPRGPAGGNR